MERTRLSTPKTGFVRIEKTSHYVEITPWWKNVLTSFGFAVMTETVTYDVPREEFEEES